MVWDHLNPTSFTPLPARAEDLRQEQNDESARERTEREG
jgi:hypothetical protein